MSKRTVGMWLYTNGGGDKIAKKIISKLKERENVFLWIVPSSPHSRMARHPEFEKRVNQFLDFVEKEEEKIRK